MSEPLFGDPLNPMWHSSDWFDAKNVSGETIPAHAVVMVTDSGEITDTKEYFLSIDQYDESNDLVFVNSNKSVTSATPFTEISKVYPQLALYNTATTPAVGDEWGPINGSWRLGPDGSGFVILGIVDSTEGIAIVDKVIAGGSCDYIKFTIDTVYTTGGVCTHADVTIDWVPCLCDNVPEDDSGTVTVYDEDCQFEGISQADLVGLKGDAKYMKPYGGGDCKWVIVDLCCPDTTC